jgi:hypothetical protein
MHTVRPLAYPERFAGVVVELAQSAPVHEFGATAIGPAPDVVDVPYRCVAVRFGAPVAVPGADERFEDSVECAASGVAAGDDAGAGD